MHFRLYRVLYIVYATCTRIIDIYTQYTLCTVDLMHKGFLLGNPLVYMPSLDFEKSGNSPLENQYFLTICSKRFCGQKIVKNIDFQEGNSHVIYFFQIEARHLNEGIPQENKLNA